MNGPVMRGVDLISLIDAYGGMPWEFENRPHVDFMPLVTDSSELTIGTQLMRISADEGGVPWLHVCVASPFFGIKRQGFAVVLQDHGVATDDTFSAQSRMAAFWSRAELLHNICIRHQGREYKRPQHVRYLLVK